MKSLLLVLGLCSLNLWAQDPQTDKTSLTIRPGEVRYVEFPYPKATKVKFTCRDQEVKFVFKNEKGRAFIMESYFSELKPFTCQVDADGKITHVFNVSVEDKEFPAEQLRVDGGKLKLSAKNQKRADAEQIVLNEIYASSVPDFLFNGPFICPMDFVTSIYGKKRVYNGTKKGQHLGIDFRAPVGTKVPAAASGKVVFAGDLFYTGWTVIIDHGLDIFTVYGHLSKTLVKAGEMIKTGEPIALSGATGRSTGPHLHWGVKIQGQYIDGFVLIEETKKQFRE